MKIETKGTGKPLIFSTGEVARQAGGSVLVYQGDSVVLVTATTSKDERKGIDFLPLVVEYQEMSYAAGRIKGGFIKRDGRPGTQEILTARCIDRPIRPLFPKGYYKEIQVIAMVLSADPDCTPDVMAINGASAALHISNIPFDGPIGGARVGLIDGEFVIDPSVAQLENSQMELLVVGTKDAIVMVEGEAKELPEQTIIDGISFAHTRILEIIEAIEDLRVAVGKEKIEVPSTPEDPDLYEEIKSLTEERFKEIIAGTHTKQRRQELTDQLRTETIERYAEDTDERQALVKMTLAKVEKETLRHIMR